MPKFQDIFFKYTDADEECRRIPELFEDAYVDINGILEDIRRPDKFLVVGPKGAGKTALSAKLFLQGVSSWDTFVSTDILEQFEYQLLEKTGGGKQLGGAITVWQLLLFLRLLPIFLQDEKFCQQNGKLVLFESTLKKHGLVESSSLLQIVQYTSRRGVYAGFKKAFAEIKGSIEDEKSYKIKDPAALLNSIKEEFKTLSPTSSSYCLLLDGLDCTLRAGRNHSSKIADLINASRELNLYFSDMELDAKVVILIRDDVLKALPDPNLTKRMTDNGVQLRWYDNTRAPFDTNLLEIIEKRAHLVGFIGSIKDLWGSWFPNRIHGKGSLDFVLTNTRFLPRDLISFFRELQNFGKEPPFTEVDILSALNNYSDWFHQELQDALVGFIEEDLRTEVSDIISDLGKNFSLQEFQEAVIRFGGATEKQKANQIARALFNASWVGNCWRVDGKKRYSWRHRKVNAKLSLKHSLEVHPGLWKTLNLI